MKKLLGEHIASLFFVLFVLIVLANVLPNDGRDKPSTLKKNALVERLSDFDLQDPQEVSIFMESAAYLVPQRPLLADSLMSVLEAEQLKEFKPPPRGRKPLSLTYAFKLIRMLAVFYFVFLLTLAITYYGVESLAVWRFVYEKQKRPGLWPEMRKSLKAFAEDKRSFSKWENYTSILKLIARIFAWLIVSMFAFAPAYVIAYSLKTRLSMSSVLFMIVLAVISNGLLITYMQKFYTFLISENRKGFVETAIVKNLNNDYRHSISYRQIFSLQKKFPDHVFNAIFTNARVQYFKTLKEQAAFLVTGLIIIEMALNIQGHVCYELLQNLLYKNHGATALILFGIFLIIKLTEMAVDIGHSKIVKHFDNE